MGCTHCSGLLRSLQHLAKADIDMEMDDRFSLHKTEQVQICCLEEETSLECAGEGGALNGVVVDVLFCFTSLSSLLII